MTTNVSTFYDTSTDTNVVNFRTLVEEFDNIGILVKNLH